MIYETLRLPKTFEYLFVSLILASSASVTSAQQELFGVQIRASSPVDQDRWQLFNHINDDSTVANPDSTLFSIAGGIYGAAMLEGVFYSVELENGTFMDYLVTMPTEGNALGSRVSQNPIGFSDVEGLANVDGQLMGISLDFPSHVIELPKLGHVIG